MSSKHGQSSLSSLGIAPFRILVLFLYFCKPWHPLPLVRKWCVVFHQAASVREMRSQAHSILFAKRPTPPGTSCPWTASMAAGCYKNYYVRTGTWVCVLPLPSHPLFLVCCVTYFIWIDYLYAILIYSLAKELGKNALNREKKSLKNNLFI